MRFLKGIGIIVGLMFGAGAFALPYVISRSGVLWGMIHLAIALFITIFLLFLYAKIIYSFEGKHRFVGYVERILGKGYKKFSMLIVLVSYYSTLLVYGVLGGVFVSNFFGGNYVTELTLLFLAAGSVIIFLRLAKIAIINFYLTVPLFAVIVYLFYVALPFVRFSNFPLTLNGFSGAGDWFLPYGVWIFSFGAMAAIPEARDLFSSSFKSFKKVISVSVLLSAVFYCLFIFSILGTSGQFTSPDALSGVLGSLGRRAVLIGSAMGFLAVFTSFLALGVDLRDIFRYDYGFSKKLAWLFVISPPVVLYFLGLQNFTVLISLVGAIGGGIGYVLTILMARKIKTAEETGITRVLLELVVLIALLLAVFYEIWHVAF